MITKYESFFSDEVCVELDNLINKITSKQNADIPQYTTSIHRWGDGLISHSTPILRYFIPIEYDNLITKIKKEIFSKTKYEIDNVLIHFWPKLSYITWHNDSGYKGALTIYLNKKWDSNWGGYLMYEENNEIKAIKPEYNLGILQENGVSHCVSTINVNADVRISIQVFLNKTKKML
jgi:Rps23 Pro-64 3,4-dihydroxylase Tpa1-like proline 4-hydroxylase